MLGYSVVVLLKSCLVAWFRSCQHHKLAPSLHQYLHKLDYIEIAKATGWRESFIMHTGLTNILIHMQLALRQNWVFLIRFNDQI